MQKLADAAVPACRQRLHPCSEMGGFTRLFNSYGAQVIRCRSVDTGWVSEAKADQTKGAPG